MCTVSFVPTTTGYFVAMNRDELLTRAPADPPRVSEIGGVQVLAPAEADTRGTWIATNAYGLTLALLNRNPKQPQTAPLRSRGEIIPALISATHSEEYERRLRGLELQRFRSFLVIAIFPAERIALEFLSQSDVRVRTLTWERHHWFSSGLSDDRATLLRSAVCESSRPAASGDTPSWLRTLHQQHHAEAAFGMCVHRPDAATLSYTEIEVSDQRVDLRYKNGSACATLPLETSSLLKLS